MDTPANIDPTKFLRTLSNDELTAIGGGDREAYDAAVSRYDSFSADLRDNGFTFSGDDEADFQKFRFAEAHLEHEGTDLGELGVRAFEGFNRFAAGAISYATTAGAGLVAGSPYSKRRDAPVEFAATSVEGMQQAINEYKMLWKGFEYLWADNDAPEEVLQAKFELAKTANEIEETRGSWRAAISEHFSQVPVDEDAVEAATELFDPLNYIGGAAAKGIAKGSAKAGITDTVKTLIRSPLVGNVDRLAKEALDAAGAVQAAQRKLSAVQKTARSLDGDELLKFTDEALTPATTALKESRATEFAARAAMNKAMDGIGAGLTRRTVAASVATAGKAVETVGQGISRVSSRFSAGGATVAHAASGGATAPISAALNSANIVTRVGRDTRVVGELLAQGKATVPFFRRLSAAREAGGITKAAAGLVDRSQVAWALSATGRAGAAVAPAAAFSGAFGYIASGGDAGAAAESAGAGGVFGISGAVMGSWQQYTTPGARIEELAANRRVYLDSLSKRPDGSGASQEKAFRGLKPQDQLMLATFAQSHPDLAWRFDSSLAENESGGYLRDTDEIVINPSSRDPVKDIFVHEIAHGIEERGLGVAARTQLVGNAETGQVGEYTQIGEDGKPVTREDGTYETTDEFKAIRAEYAAKLGADEASFSDGYIASEIFAEHYADRALGGTMLKDLRRTPVDRIVSALANRGVLKDFMGKVGLVFDSADRVVGSGVFKELRRSPAIDKLAANWNRDRSFGDPIPEQADIDTSFGEKELRDKSFARKWAGSGGSVKVNEKGDPVYKADGTPVYVTKKQADAEQAALAEAVRIQLDIFSAENPDGGPVSKLVDENGGEKYVGEYLPDEVIEALEASEQFNPHQIANLRAATALAKEHGGGAMLLNFYQAASRKGKSGYKSVSGRWRRDALYGFQLTRGGNIVLNTVSWETLFDNVRKASKSKAARTTWSDAGGPIEDAMVSDVTRYLGNISSGKPGAQGIGEAKRDFINNLFGYRTKGIDVNPWHDTTKSPKTFFTSLRLDRMNRVEPLDTVSWKWGPEQNRAVKLNRRPEGTQQTDTPEFKAWFGGSKVVDESGAPKRVVHATDAEFTTFKRRRGDIGIHFGTEGQANDRSEFLRENNSTRRNGSWRSIPAHLTVKNPIRLRDPGTWDYDNLNYQLKEFFPEPEVRAARTTAGLRKLLQKHGYDGIVYQNTGEVEGSGKYREAIADARANLKARFGNRNSFSLEDQASPEYQTYSKAMRDYAEFREEAGVDSWIVFEPTQIKSAIGNTGAFDSKNPDIRLRPEAQGHVRTEEEDVKFRPTVNEASRTVAADYFQNAFGVELSPHSEYEKLPTQDLQDLADLLDAAEHSPEDADVQASYQTLMVETAAQYEAMLSAGVSIEPWTETSGEPYANSAEMVRDVTENNHLWFFLTDNGFGSGGDAAGHPLMVDSGVEINGTPLVYNDLFRAVHDYFGHTQQGFQFGPRGEFNAWREHSKMFSSGAQGALAAETLAQNAWVNNGKHIRREDGTVPAKGEDGFIAPQDRPFADQKAFIVPPETLAQFRPESQTDTPEFKAWFGDSKVVDASGKPLVVYHGTNEDFESFDVSRSGSRDPGFFGDGVYFTPSIDDAFSYADSAAEDRGRGDARVVSSHVSLRNPFIWDMSPDGESSTREALAQMGLTRNSVRGDSASLSNADERSKFRRGLSKYGHDGVIIRDEDGLREVVAFREDQIRPAPSEVDTQLVEEIVPKNQARPETATRPTTKKALDKVLTPKDGELQFTVNRDAPIELVHYAKLPDLTEIDPAFMKPKADVYSRMYRGVPKSFFFVDGTKPGSTENVNETFPFRYSASIDGSKLYDFSNDEAGLWFTPNVEVLEQAMMDAGYDGFYAETADGRKFAALFHPMPVDGTEVTHTEPVEGDADSFDEVPEESDADAKWEAWQAQRAKLSSGSRKPNRNPLRKRNRPEGSGNVDTPEFRRWFGESKAVDESGSPQVVYHGAHEDFSEFDNGAALDREALRLERKGLDLPEGKFNVANNHYFTSSPKHASEYAEDRAVYRGRGRVGSRVDTRSGETSAIWEPTGANVVPAFLKMEDPLQIDAGGAHWTEIPLGEETFTTDALAGDAREAGHDGLIIRNVQDTTDTGGELSDVYVVFDGAQIKSAIGNRGTFDPKDPDIRNRPELGKTKASDVQNSEASKPVARDIGQDEASDSHLRVSTRIPTAAKRTEDGLATQLAITGADVLSDSGKLKTVAAAFRKYPNTPKGIRSPKKVVSELQAQAVDNLLWLHDTFDPELRERAKLWYDGARKLTEDWSGKYDLPRESVAGVLAALSPQKDWFMNVDLGRRVIEHSATLQGRDLSEGMVDWFRGKFGDKKPALLESLLLDVGRPIENLGLLERATMIRAYDEIAADRGYQILTPEGDFSGPATTNSGARSRVAWGDFGAIAKALSMVEDASRENISSKLGGEHKVRNFFNNILLPNNAEHGDVTIDTHAVAAALIRPLAGSDVEVSHNLGGTGVPGSAITGASGTYGIFADVYREAAAKRGRLPREMQSITWEAVRGLFPAGFKNAANKAKVDALWKRHQDGELKIDEVRNQILSLAGGIDTPSWARPRN